MSGNSIPAPTGFPIEWEQPGDENLRFAADQARFPDVLTPLDGSLITTILFQMGSWRMAEDFERPTRLQARRINGYFYLASEPLSLPPEELAMLDKRFRNRLQAAAMSLGRDWRQEYLPEIQRLIAETAGTDFRARRLPELARDLDDAIERSAREWEIHFKVTAPVSLAQRLFEEFYLDLFPEQETLDALRLLQGLGNLTVRMGRDLWQLSRVAWGSPEVINAFEQSEPPGVIATLQESAAGRDVLRQFDDWLETYGHRGDGLGISCTPWIEDPTPILRMLREYAARANGDPSAEQSRLAAAREAAIAAARARLNGYPRVVVEQFEALLQAAQDATVIHEDHGHWIDFRGTYELRRVVVAIGARLADAGALEDQDDLVYLTLPELAEAARDHEGRDWGSLVRQRKTEMAYFATLTPPRTVGAPPAGSPKGESDNSMPRAKMDSFGAPPAAEPGLIQGMAGSAGTVKVIHSLDEAHKLQPGDILVVRTPTPAWTVLFNTAAALVTDAGGVLSHSAVVVREYGIPAVVGTGIGATVLKDGDRVAVDGSAGTVRSISG